MAPPPNGAKKKPIPTWYYLAGGGALIGLYYLYSRSQASKLAAQAAAATPTTTGASSATAPVAAGSPDQLPSVHAAGRSHRRRDNDLDDGVLAADRSDLERRGVSTVEPKRGHLRRRRK